LAAAKSMKAGSFAQLATLGAPLDDIFAKFL
jgi:hypothetical protein